MAQQPLLHLLEEIARIEDFMTHIDNPSVQHQAYAYTASLHAKYANILQHDGDKPTILVDMDEVLADLITPWLSRYNADYGDTLTPHDLTDFNTSLFVKPSCGAKVYDYFKEPGFFRHLNPLPHAQQFIGSLVDDGMRVLVVSDSPKGNSFCDFAANPNAAGNPADDKRAWLAEYFPMIPASHVVFTSQKWFVQGDIIVDDKPSTFLEFQKRGRKAILMDQPYNRSIDTHYRALHLGEAKPLIDDLLHPKVMV